MAAVAARFTGMPNASASPDAPRVASIELSLALGVPSFEPVIASFWFSHSSTP
jgi:hypothetical protein